MTEERNLGCSTLFVLWLFIALPIFAVSRAIDKLTDAIAQVDTRPQGGDAKQAPFTGSAAPSGVRPNTTDSIEEQRSDVG